MYFWSSIVLNYLEGHKIINSIEGMDGFSPYFHPIGCYFIEFIHELYKFLVEVPTFLPHFTMLLLCNLLQHGWNTMKVKICFQIFKLEVVVEESVKLLMKKQHRSKSRSMWSCTWWKDLPWLKDKRDLEH
jgi:hypothetical protein